MDRTDLEWVTPNPAGKWEASGRNDTSTPRSKLMLIEFVVNSGDNKSQIRRHAIRESWRQRNHGRSKLPATHRGPGARETLPKIAHRHQNTPSTGKEAAVAESDLKIEAEWGRRTLYSSGGPDIPGAEVAKRERLHAFEARTTLSTCHLPQGLSLRHPLGDAGFGPVNGIHLSREDKKLLHHWVNVDAHDAYGFPSDPVFDPIRNLFVAVDLTQPACVHATLAYSASHLAFLRQERSRPIQAITHKMTAIRIVNQSLNDPQESISDGTFSAVCRLITFERYRGTDAGWRLHLKGLEHMLRKRGGLSTFQSNWKLELRLHMILLMSKPQWSKSAFAMSGPKLEDDSMPENTFDVLLDQEMPHSDFVNFFSDITTIDQEAVDHYPVIARAVAFVRAASDEQGQENARVMCLFYVAIIFKHLGQLYRISQVAAPSSDVSKLWKTRNFRLKKEGSRGGKIMQSQLVATIEGQTLNLPAGWRPQRQQIDTFEQQLFRCP